MLDVFAIEAIKAPALWGFGVSFALCIVLVLTQRWHGALTTDSTDGIQKFHTTPTPRVGGIPIFFGFIAAWLNSPQSVQELLTPILIAGLPAFLSGVIEDLTKKVGVAERLIATMISGLLACWLTGYSITHANVIGIDTLLQISLVSILFTSFAVAGVANAINIVDGFNGLASTAATLSFVGYAMIAYAEGDHSLAMLAMILAACVWGFFWVNWPFGKIFLGDGGSYFVGFSLAWVAVLLIERNPSVSAFAALIVCVHPVTEVLFSIYRRRARKLHPGMPDRMHFHSLFKRRYVARWFSRFNAPLRNSVAGLVIGLMTLPAIIVTTFVYGSVWLSAICFAVFFIGYVAIYARMVVHSWSLLFRISKIRC
jgi:UDP-N-acetylmuramyl pentapeptide phosphotransferase/UDP-N-acetylglucosamine-1-phosphate transferase